MILKMEDVSVRTSEDESMDSENDPSPMEDSDDSVINGNSKLADALAKAIRMGKSKNGKSVVLSKAKLYTPNTISKQSHGFEIVPDPNKEIKTEVDEEEDVKPDVEDIKPSKKEFKKLRIPRQEKIQRGRLKPSPLDREKEKPLVKIATKGVVQLFNAVKQQQTIISKQIDKKGVTESKKEKVLKSIDKKAFLDVLMGKNKTEKSQSNMEETQDLEDDVKSEPEEKEEPSWEVLRDDFMMGAKLKDWDKKEIEVMEE